MALIKCTECGKEFSNKASSCPNCGCPIEEILKDINSKSNSTTNFNKPKETPPPKADILLSQLYKKYPNFPTYAAEEYAAQRGISKAEAKKIVNDYYQTAPPAKFTGDVRQKKKGSCLKTIVTVIATFIILLLLVGSCGSNNEQPETNTNIIPNTTNEEAASNEIETIKEDNSIPSEYKSALKKAYSYSERMHMSKAGIYNQLTSEYGEQFTAEAAQYAIDSMEVDWNYNALKKAESYSDSMYMSKQGVFDQLTSEYGEQFTEEEAQYAVDNVDADWNYNALQKAKSYRDNMDMSPAAIHDQLTSEYGEQFTEEEADYAIANLN